MLEWYRVQADYRMVIADTLDVVRLAAELAGRKLTYLDRTCDPHAETEWLTVSDAFRIYAGMELPGYLVAGRRMAIAICWPAAPKRAGASDCRP